MRARPIFAAVLLVAAVLLAACTGAPSPTTAEPTPVIDEVRILAVDLWADHPDSPFSVDAAADEAEYGALWQRVGVQVPQPEVDLDRELVLFLGMAGSSSCPERFERLVVDATSRVYAEWARLDDGRACTDDLAQQGVLIAVLRSALPGEPFPFSLRQEPICPDCPTHPDQMVVDPG